MRGLALAVLFSASAAGAHAADPLVDAFRQGCASVADGPGGVLADTSGGGWAKADPATFRDTLSGGVLTPSAIGRVHASPDGEIQLIAQELPKATLIAGTPAHIRMCEATAPVVVDGAAAQVAAWLGPAAAAAAVRSQPSTTRFSVLRQPGGGFAPLPSGAEATPELAFSSEIIVVRLTPGSPGRTTLSVVAFAP